MAKKQLTYNVSIVPDSGAFAVYVPDLEGCYSMGQTLEEAREHVKESIEGWIYVQLESGRDVPEPSAAGADLIPITVDVPDIHGHSRSA